MVADGELVVELRAGAGRLHVRVEVHEAAGQGELGYAVGHEAGVEQVGALLDARVDDEDDFDHFGDQVRVFDAVQGADGEQDPGDQGVFHVIGDY